MSIRLAIFTSHPIQYQAPWFREIAQAPDIEPLVFFGHVPTPREQGVGFGREFEWDIPLRTGYESSVLKSRRIPGPVPGFARRTALGLNAEIAQFKPDVALILGWQNLILIQALSACRGQRVPVIMRGESNAKKPRPPLLRSLHRRYLSRTDAVLAIGDANTRFFEANGVPPSRIASAHYFVENGRFAASADSLAPEREAIRSAWSIPPEALCVLFVGKLQPKKCVFDAIEAIGLAAARGLAVHGLIVGSGEQMEEARRRASDLPLTFAGFLNQSEIVKAYLAADVIVLPSDYNETWGLVINEAMATGTPAIVSDRVGCADDLVVDGETGFVTPFADPPAIAAALERLGEDRNLLARLGAAARERVHRDYSIAAAMDGLRQAIAIASSRSAET